MKIISSLLMARIILRTAMSMSGRRNGSLRSSNEERRKASASSLPVMPLLASILAAVRDIPISEQRASVTDGDASCLIHRFSNTCLLSWT